MASVKSFVVVLFLPQILCHESNTTSTNTTTTRLDLLSSFYSLKYFATLEHHLFKIISAWKPSLENKLYQNDLAIWDKLQEFAKDYNITTLKHVAGLKNQTARQDIPEVVASNLVLVARMTSRLVKFGAYLKEFVSSSKHPSGFPVCNTTIAQFLLEPMPGISDYQQMLSTFTVISNIIGLYVNPPQVVHILSKESSTPASISAQVSSDISSKAVEQFNYVDAFDWINYSIYLVSEEGDNSSNLDKLVAQKHSIVEKHNSEFFNLDEYHTGFFEEPISLEQIGTPEENHLWRRKDSMNYFMKGNTSAAEINMWSLCSGLNLQKREVRSKLKCFRDVTSHPWLRINPLHVEVLSESPEVLQFHDILGETLISKIVQLMDKRPMETSMTEDGPGRNPRPFFEVRSSIQTWFTDEEMPKLAQITEVVSGRNVRDGDTIHTMPSEHFQAVEYVVGRHYTLHTDTLCDECTSMDPFYERDGDRISTLLFYLNDVDLGGDTGFVNLGFAPKPTKGSAIFWNNMYRNGTSSTDTSWHCSCPVLRGRKLVINKWIHYNAQFLKYPCTLNQWE